MTTTTPVVHILFAGLAMCQFSETVPRDWSTGHVWVGRDEAHKATCERCKEINKAMGEKTMTGQ